MLFAFLYLSISGTISAQNSPFLEFDFDQHLNSEEHKFIGSGYNFVNGIEGQALALSSDKGFSNLKLVDVALSGAQDFSIQCWVKTNSNKPTVFLSQKYFDNKGIVAQKNPGWVLYSSGGTFAWSIGSGERRINYEVDNGEMMPIDDGDWHQLTITFNKELSEFRLYYDGEKRLFTK